MEVHEIDAHVDANADTVNSINITQDMAAELKLVNICKIYQAVRPVLKFAKGLLFFKHKWQSFIQKLLDSLDAVCPTETT